MVRKNKKSKKSGAKTAALVLMFLLTAPHLLYASRISSGDGQMLSNMQEVIYTDDGDNRPGGGTNLPRISILTPVQDFLTNQPELTVTGTYSNASSVSVNGISADLLPPGNYTESYASSNQDGFEPLAATQARAQLAQSFRAGVQGKLTQASLNLSKPVGSPSGQLSVEIQGDDGTGRPDNIMVPNGISSMVDEAGLAPEFQDTSFEQHPIQAAGTPFIDFQPGAVSGTSAFFNGGGSYLRLNDHPSWQLGGSGGGSASFDGTDDYLSLPDSDDWQLGGGAGDFTIDFWVRFNSVSMSQRFMSQVEDLGCCNYWTFGWNNTNTLLFQVRENDVVTINIGKNWTPAANTWYHIALVRSGNNFRMFVNGAQLGAEDTYNSTIPDFTAELQVAAALGGTRINGWLDEVRISNTARWTSNFTPQRQDYAPDANTKLLLHFNSNFSDASASAHSATIHGDTQISNSFYPFSKDFTIETRLKFNTAAGQQGLFVQGGGTGARAFRMIWKGAHDPRLQFSYSADGAAFTSAYFPWAPENHRWYHVAFVKNADLIKLFVDGAQIVAPHAVTANAIFDSPAELWIGSNASGNGAPEESFNGWLDEVRISDVSRYSGNFAPPQAAHLPDENTKLLLHFDNPSQMTVFTFPIQPALQAGSRYHLVLKTTRAPGAAHYIAWGKDSSNPTFTAGQAGFGNSAVPPLWAAEPGSDFIFSLNLHSTVSTFTVSGIPLEEGENLVTAAAAHQGLNSSDSRRVTLDTIPPSLEMSPALAERKGMTETEYTFEALAVDEDSSPLEYQFELNGTVLQPYSESNIFTYTPEASQSGSKALTVKARDMGGEAAQDIGIYIYRKPGTA